WQSLPVAAGAAAAKAPGVTAVTSVVSDRGRTAGKNIDVSGIDPRTIAGPYRFDWAQGSDASARSLRSGQAIVSKSSASEHDHGLGSRCGVVGAGGRVMPLRVKAIYEPAKFDPLLGSVLVTRSTFASAYPRSPLAFTLVQGGTMPSLQHALRAFPDAKARTTEEYISNRAAGLAPILNLLYVLLALSGIVSLFGMWNALGRGVFARPGELGMLGAVGMTRRQARRMVRHESVITALIGAALGIPLGLGFAAMVTQALSKYGVGFSVPAK